MFWQTVKFQTITMSIVLTLLQWSHGDLKRDVISLYDGILWFGSVIGVSFILAIILTIGSHLVSMLRHRDE